MKKIRIHVMLVAFLLSIASIRCSSGSSLLKSGSPLMNTLGSNPNLSSVTNLMKTPGLDKILGNAMKSPFTLLAPTNDALANMGPGAIENLSKPENVNQLGDMLLNQMVPGKLDATTVTQDGLKSAGGKPLNLAGVNMGTLVSSEKFNIIPVDKVLP